MFNDTKRHAVSLRQLSFLFYELCKKIEEGVFFANTLNQQYRSRTA